MFQEFLLIPKIFSPKPKMSSILYLPISTTNSTDMARQTAIQQTLVPPSTVWTGADTRNVFVLSALLVGLALYASKMISTDVRVKAFMQVRKCQFQWANKMYNKF
jgi:hypothetical protein